MDFMKSLIEQPVKEILENEYFLTEDEFKEYVSTLRFMGKELEEHLEDLRSIGEDLEKYHKILKGVDAFGYSYKSTRVYKR